jgi:hypothetical protein
METKNCQKCKKDFNIEAEDFDFYQKINVPAPTFCPECRLQRRLTFRNDRMLYKRACELCKKEVISIYRPNGPQKIVCQKCWWSDDFDATAHGKEYDFSKSFFEQYRELMNEVPFVATFVVDESRMINSPYNNMVLDLRNCYLLSNADFDEDCSYGCEIEHSRTCVDNNLIHQSEMCYECVNMQNCYRAFYSIDCESSSDIWFSRDCNGCTDCFGCVNLRKKSYCIFNEPMGTKEAYMAKLAELGLDSRGNIEDIKGKVHEFWKTGITKYMHEKQNENVSGDYIYNSKSVTESWIVHEGWNVKHSQYLVAGGTKDSYDFTQYGDNAELHYEVLQGGGGGSRVRFSWFVPSENRDIDYCMQIMTSHNMFGCIGLRKKEYCILNKQYTKEEYEKLRAEILKQMNEIKYKDSKGLTYGYGEFFPSDISPFVYNETSAQEVFPLSEVEAQSKGFAWVPREVRNYQPTIATDKIPDTIAEVEEDITKDIIECLNKGDERKNCTTAFRVIPDEVGFYKRFNIPLPAKCPNCRHAERMTLRNPPRFHTATCSYDICSKEVITAYPERTQNLYCKEHYLQNIV